MPRPANRRNDFRARTHPAYWAFVVHRLSGVALTLFLPLHFFVLSRALQGEAALAGVLRWTDAPGVKAGEVLIVLSLAAHVAGGVRLLLIEFVGWQRERRKCALAVGAGIVLAYGLLDALGLIA
jgi:fumarate reductase subunit D